VDLLKQQLVLSQPLHRDHHKVSDLQPAHQRVILRPRDKPRKELVLLRVPLKVLQRVRLLHNKLLIRLEHLLEISKRPCQTLRVDHLSFRPLQALNDREHKLRPELQVAIEHLDDVREQLAHFDLLEQLAGSLVALQAHQAAQEHVDDHLRGLDMRRLGHYQLPQRHLLLSLVPGQRLRERLAHKLAPVGLHLEHGGVVAASAQLVGQPRQLQQELVQDLVHGRLELLFVLVHVGVVAEDQLGHFAEVLVGGARGAVDWRGLVAGDVVQGGD